MNRKNSLLLLIAFIGTSCYQESRLLVNANFQASIENDNYTAPVRVRVENNSTGADFYQWTFEGGEPAISTDKTPANVTYRQAGSYTIILEAWNEHERDRKEFTFSVDSTVTVSFEVKTLINDFAPANVEITNHTQGASSFLWTFEGGEPATSTEQHPGTILFGEEGEHTISLIVDNGRESFNLSKKIRLDPSLSVDFEIEPSFDDFDYELPFTASLFNKTMSGLSYEWITTGGIIDDKHAENTTISIINPGDYTITLQGENGKETKTQSKQITVKPNSNLYTIKDVKFGIKQATSVGSFYSLKHRRIIPQNEVSETNGQDINLVFFGVNASFEKCYFTSPDLAQDAGFYAIPNAAKTYFVNTPETGNLRFSSDAFDAMLNDAPLKLLDIRAESNTDTWFIANPVPRIVLFETADGRKGAIKVKAFVSEQMQSYVWADIKFQKEKNP